MFQNEGYSLFNDDCLNVLKDIDPDNVILVSDPPFNIGYHYHTYKDKLKEEEYYDFLISVFSNYKHVMIHYPESLYKYSLKLKVAPEKVISWVYNSNNHRQHRDIAYFGLTPDFKKRGQDYKNPTDKRIKKLISQGKRARLYDWWNVNQVKNVSKDKTAHPCQMPIEVMENIIGTLPDNVTVVDPFMGSGTTGLACKNLKVDFIGMEMDEEYFKIAKERMSK